ncbi:hypothetical protein I6M49_22330 [Shewanella algae]|uniref:hypothetical protein n=1 Tax=Shewanella algae TaxID=38313 RepID=UPI001AACE7DD|nr:hypothetical protein [Shewanella algae]MBO2656184.1 hypothetical protein [Shewanella algae]
MMFTIYEVHSGSLLGQLRDIEAMSDQTEKAYQAFCQRWGGNECCWSGCRVTALLFSRNAPPTGWRHLGGNAYAPQAGSVAAQELAAIVPHLGPQDVHHTLGLPGEGLAFAEKSPQGYRLYLTLSGSLPDEELPHCQLIGQSPHLPTVRLAA